MSSSGVHYALGRVLKVTLVMEDGSELEISNAEVDVTVENEFVEHYTMSGGRRHRSQHLLSNNTKIDVRTRDDVIEELDRLIRKD